MVRAQSSRRRGRACAERAPALRRAEHPRAEPPPSGERLVRAARRQAGPAATLQGPGRRDGGKTTAARRGGEQREKAAKKSRIVRRNAPGRVGFAAKGGVQRTPPRLTLLLPQKPPRRRSEAPPPRTPPQQEGKEPAKGSAAVWSGRHETEYQTIFTVYNSKGQQINVQIGE